MHQAAKPYTVVDYIRTYAYCPRAGRLGTTQGHDFSSLCERASILGVTVLLSNTSIVIVIDHCCADTGGNSEMKNT